ncbi:Uncharacterised protein [Legionella pneumophila]|uniref:Type IV conjugative transfer system protein TraV n=4 Tax=Legionella TaxID=445 RepID=A0AAN5PJ99_LEGPN|nr:MULTISPECIES: hypothetical protein [Legionella]ERB42491.1 hypothetical protein N748_03870 [Legionella pneumophila str. 121004]ERH43356.1 hypothetical protein N751_15995 [Legionella pneumophila str. Leg01/11]CAH17204.1 hypothetical protein plpp0027 [Legionella pneumophila str. Paris]ANN97244.1 hypothetical protein A9P84_15845 [Legionella pneumophila]KTC67797.1 Type IV conjugative transfer system protein TraV [Legionella bozemanae]
MVKAWFVLFCCCSAVTLTGCSRSIFDHQDVRCPFVERGGCQSMEQVNRMVDARRFTPDGQYVQQEQCVGCSAYSK